VCPEQALMTGWLNSHRYNVNLPYTSYVSRKGFYLFELLLSINFNTLNWEQTDILYPERFLSSPVILDQYVYRAEDINVLHEKYNFLIFNRRFLYCLKIIYLDKFLSIFFGICCVKRFY
jgi:hypothetical protein